MQKNRFAAAAVDDSDDDVAVQKQTKTQKKKEERKVAAPATEKAVKFNPNKMAEGGFSVVQAEGKDAKPTGGKGAANLAKHGHHEGHRAGYKHAAEGVDVKERRERQPFRGKAREEGHPYDRRDGTGAARRGDRKAGFGRGGWGERPDQIYKRKGEDDEEFAHDVTKPKQQHGRGGHTQHRPQRDHKDKEEKKEKEEEKAEVQVVEEVIGYSLDEVIGQRAQATGRKEARAPEGVKGEKVQALDAEKVKQSTVQQNQYAKDTLAKQADPNNDNVLLGFSQVPDEDDERRGGKRGGRGGHGGHGHGHGHAQEKRDHGHAHGNKGGRKNAKQALKMTEDDYPSLS